MSHDHDAHNGHSEAHDHDHGEADPRALRTEALEALLTEQGIVTPEGIDSILKHYEEDVGPMNGARAVARAWVDAEYRRRLLEDGSAAVKELGFGGAQGERLVVVENTAGTHNVVVCTLCSCYPWPVLGLPPSWYKSPAYRSRVVREPRAVLKEFGLELDPKIEIQVWDSSAEVRYLVLPLRPAGTEELSEAELAGIVGRDAMIGVALAGQ